MVKQNIKNFPTVRRQQSGILALISLTFNKAESNFKIVRIFFFNF